MTERPIRILVHPGTDRDLLTRVREVLDRAVAERPEHWFYQPADGSAAEFWGWEDPHRTTTVLTREGAPYVPHVFWRLTIWPGRDSVHDQLADLVRDHYGL